MYGQDNLHAMHNEFKDRVRKLDYSVLVARDEIFGYLENILHNGCLGAADRSMLLKVSAIFV